MTDNRKLITFLVLLAVVALALVAAWPMLFTSEEANAGSPATQIPGDTVVATIDADKLLYENYAPYRGVYAYFNRLDLETMNSDVDFNTNMLDTFVNQYFIDKHYTSTGIVADEAEVENELNLLLPYLYQGLDDAAKEQVHMDYGFTDETVYDILYGEVRYNNCLVQMMDETRPTDDETLDFYNQNPEYFTYAEDLWHLRHILVPTEGEIHNVLARLGQGEDFASLAQEVSVDYGSAENGGDLGTVARSTANFVEPFQETALALTVPGEISGAVYSEFGWHVIKLDEFFPQGTTVSFEEIKGDLVDQLAFEEAEYAFHSAIDELVAAASVEKFYDSVLAPSNVTPE